MHHSGLGLSALAATTLLFGCGGGGGAGAAPTIAGAGAFVPATLRLVGSSPSDQSVGVQTDSVLRLFLDAAVAPACLAQPETGLFEAGTDNRIVGIFGLSTDARVLTFQPSGSLLPNTVYDLRLSPLTCTADGRLLERLETVRFRTGSVLGPRILTCDPPEDSQLFAGRPDIVVDLDCRVDEASLGSAEVVFRIDDGRVIEGDLVAVPTDPTGESRLVTRPRSDLPANRSLTLEFAGLRSVSGVPTSSSTFRFTTGGRGPVPTSVQDVSPAQHPAFGAWMVLSFNRSLDPGTLTQSSFVWVDPNGLQQPADWALNSDRRLIAVRAPLNSAAGSIHTLRSGSVSILDSDGQAVQPFSRSFALKRPNPVVAASSTFPAYAEEDVPTRTSVRVEFDRAVLAPSPSAIDWTQRRHGRTDPVAIDRVELDATGRALTIHPAHPLELDADVVLTIDNGPFGLRTVDGVPSVQPLELAYRTSAIEDWEIEAVLPDGIGNLPRSAVFLVRSSVDLEPAAVTGLRVLNSLDASIGIDASLHTDRRTIAVRPSGTWPIDEQLRLVVPGGPSGIRSADGRWRAADIEFGFRSGFGFDAQSPRVTISVEGIPAQHTASPRVPPLGFALAVESPSTVGDMLDPRSVVIELSGAAFGSRSFDLDDCQLEEGRIVLPIGAEIDLQPGVLTATAIASDLSGNQADVAETTFEVTIPTIASVPFERAQLARVRFDLDRDGDGTPDFRQDLIRLGLASVSDPLGVDERMERIIRDGVLARAHALFERNLDGSRRDDGDSVPIRLTTEMPIGVPFMEIACGGLDPEGEPGRVTGDPSSGTLGRAYFDSRNASLTEGAVGTDPGLGVFPAEVFLFEAEIHLRLAPGFLTSFGRAFAPIAPDLGGVPLGSHPLDPVVMDPDFDPDLSTAQQLARYRVLFQAADDWATVIGTILAHELGHTVGLTEPGIANTGLHGDDSLHNRNSAPTDIMAPTLGFEAILDLSFRFRALNLAYLRHRVVLR